MATVGGFDSTFRVLKTKQMEEQNQELELPLVYLHRSSSFTLFFKDVLQKHFRLLDPLDSSESTQSFLTRHAGSVRALLCVGPSPLTSETLSLLPSLELLVCSSAGIDHVDLEECKRRRLALTNTGSAFAEDAADYAVGLLIDVLRRVSAADRYLRAGLWPKNGDYPLGFKISGKRIGIVGLGNIGSEVAKRLLGFGCSIAYFSRSKRPALSYQYYTNIRDLASNSDALILSCALTNETHHIIDKEVLTALGKEGVVINVGRGPLIDEKELVKFLMAGEIRGAGLDVFENEPDVPKELLGLENVVLSPHRAVLTPESFATVKELVVGNLKSFFSNKPLISPVELA